MSNRSTAPTGRRRKSDGPNTNSHKSPRPQDGFNGSISTSRSNGYSNTNSNPSGNPPHTVHDDDPNAVAENTSLLQPRLAVWLGVSRRWHPFLFICRLLSIGPAVWWGFPSVVRLLALVHLKYIMHFAGVGRLSGAAGGSGQDSSYIAAATSAPSGAFLTPTYDWSSSEAKLRFTEAWVTVLWCCASGWVSFFLTDCLMSRALLNYTPLATLFRLSVINLLNTLFTSSVLGQFAAPADPRLAFVPWIVIASMLTLIYWAAQRGIRIHKEYSLSLSIFSLASYVSMLALLWHLYIERAIEYPDIPLVHNLKIAFQGAEELALKIMEYGNVTQAF